MAEPCPELVFLSGPQAGEHALVLGAQSVVGRSTQADIPLRENAASREQLVFEITPEGWVMENLSSNGTEVNGRRYKRGKKILLDTGDILGVGKETRILYVAPEDDPQQAMAERGLEPVQPTPAAPPPTDQEETEAPPQPMDSPEPAQPGAAGVAEDGDDAEALKKAKLRKYAIFGGVYVAVMVALIVFLATRGGDDAVDDGGIPKLLTKVEVTEVIESPLDVRVQSDEIKATRMLERARSHYRNREQIGNLAWAIKYFKLHQKYKGNLQFPRSQDQADFIDAKRKLAERVYDAYWQAYTNTKRERWTDAAEGFQRVREMVTPFTSQPFPDSDNLIFRNALAHLRYANSRIAAQRAR